MKNKYLTFDIDFTNYFTGELFDEFEACYNLIFAVLKSRPSIKTTWFIRIDSQIEKVYGTADYFFTKHKNKLEELKNNGHEIGWHHHSYKLEKDKWIQDTDEDVIVKDLFKYGKLAQTWGITISRIGWGYQTNKIISALNDLGFLLDSSAIPRPKYEWELSKKNWADTLQQAYYPSKQNYQVEGTDNLEILQVPINTIGIELSSDTQKDILRYLNPAYKHLIFAQKVQEFLSTNDNLVLVCHPYELLSTHYVKHELLSFSINDFEKNCAFLEQSKILSEITATLN